MSYHLSSLCLYIYIYICFCHSFFFPQGPPGKPGIPGNEGNIGPEVSICPLCSNQTSVINNKWICFGCNATETDTVSL